MIPGKFDYHRPATKTDAFKLLLDAGPDGRVLAGGHSLIPMMKLRLATPTALIDLGHISELKGISVSDKRIEIGATTTQHELIQSQELFTACPKSATAGRWVATSVMAIQVMICQPLCSASTPSIPSRA